MSDFNPGDGRDFNPGDGWVRGWVPDGATGTYEWFELYSQSYEKAGASGRSGSFVARWHRRLPDPVPSLPTEPYTVIRVTWPTGDERGYSILWLDEKATWSGWLPDHLAQHIKSFEVLSRPVVAGGIALAAVQRETAEAVIDRVHQLWLRNSSWVDVLIAVREEFGVEHEAQQ